MLGRVARSKQLESVTPPGYRRSSHSPSDIRADVVGNKNAGYCGVSSVDRLFLAAAGLSLRLTSGNYSTVVRSPVVSHLPIDRIAAILAQFVI
jgi:hypothetical protein